MNSGGNANISLTHRARLLYPSSFKLQGCWLHTLIPVTYSSKLHGINERLLSLTGGQPSAGQIRSRRICLVLTAYLQLEC
ncbi:hypothetical protein D8682_10110 [Buttiauxella sp. 3AFRM03]|nr:hypothetical protein D8682_10110 [Buttiauxella sp. 3AFRM03]